MRDRLKGIRDGVARGNGGARSLLQLQLDLGGRTGAIAGDHLARTDCPGELGRAAPLAPGVVPVGMWR